MSLVCPSWIKNLAISEQALYHSPHYVQSAKILLLSSNCKIILVPFKNDNFSNIAIVKGFWVTNPASYQQMKSKPGIFNSFMA